MCNMVCIYFNNSLKGLIAPTSSLIFSLVIWTGYFLLTYLIHLLLIYVGFVILVCEHAFHLLWGRSKQCLPPIITTPLLVGICATWIGKCWGCPYLLVILVGGFMDINIGCRSISYPFSFITAFYVNLWNS